MSDIYYNPKEYGLEIFSETEQPDMSYEFDMFVVWKDASGQLWYASDSGCSCPSPFEDYTMNMNSEHHPEKVIDLKSFEDAIQKWNKEWSYRIKNDSGVAEVTRKVREYLEQSIS